MRLLKLSLENIGPFDRAELQFLETPEDPVPVALIKSKTIKNQIKIQKTKKQKP